MSASHRLSGHQQRQKLREVMSEKAGVTGEFLLRTETVHQRPPWLSSTCLARHTRDVHEAAPHLTDCTHLTLRWPGHPT